MNSIVPTPEIIDAIKAAEKKYSTSKALANAVHTSPNYLSRWKDPDTYHLNIKEENWKKLYPVIHEFLPKDFFPTYTNDETTSPRKKAIPKETALLENLSSTLAQLAPGRQIVTGVINVGISHEKIMDAILTTNLTLEQKLELQSKIFS